MNEPDSRQELFEAIRALADAAPAMRVGQLLAAAGEICSDLHGRGLWDAEDRELLEAVWKFQKDIETNLPVEVHPKA
ncbi:MAG: hypothetical protein WD738_18070 [Pirellulales bacterium]